MAASKADLPPVTWAQRKDSVFITIALADVKDEKITLDGDKLEFR